IASLCAQLGYPSTSEDIERRLTTIAGEPDAILLVADCRHDGVIGWVHVRAVHLITRDACAEIGGLVVDTARRGGGIGTRLMAASEEAARARHAAPSVERHSRGSARLLLRARVHRFEDIAAVHEDALTWT